MDKMDTIREIARVASTAYVADCAAKALKGEISIDRALHEIANSTTRAYVSHLANKSIG